MATATRRQTGDVFDEAARVVTETLLALVTTEQHNAEVCGCPGCRAKAVNAAEWSARMRTVEEPV